MPINTSPTIRQRRLARTLRDLRVAAGLKHSDAAAVLGCAESKMTRIENAQSGIRLLDLRALLTAYGVTDPTKREEVESLARGANQKGWWARYTNVIDSAYAAYAAVEWDASEIYNVETQLIPGLLQTPEYTAAACKLQAPDSSEEAVTTQVNVKTERRKVLTRSIPLQLWVIISESVLYHRVGGPKVMTSQLEALIEASRQPNIELQVLPRASALNASLFGPFVIMSFPSQSESDIVYTDSQTSTLYYEESSDVEVYTTLFRRLNAAASNVDESRRMISTALKEMV